MIRYCVYPILMIFMLQGSGGNFVTASGGFQRMTAHAAVCSAAERNAAKDTTRGNNDDLREESTLCSFRYIIYFFWYAFCAVLFAVVIVMDMSTGCSQHYTKDFYGWCKDNTSSLDRFFHRVGCG